VYIEQMESMHTYKGDHTVTTQPSEIDVLKAQVKTLKRIVYGVVCLLVAGIALAATSMQGVPDILQAKMFEVMNDDGEVAGVFSADTRGAGFLYTKNADGRVTTELFCDGGGDGQIEVWNQNGTLCVELYGDSDGDGRLRIYNQNGGLGVDLFGAADGGILQLESTATNKPAVQLDIGEFTFMNTTTNKPAVQLDMGELTFMNNEGDEIVRLHNGDGSFADLTCTSLTVLENFSGP